MEHSLCASCSAWNFWRLHSPMRWAWSSLYKRYRAAWHFARVTQLVSDRTGVWTLAWLTHSLLPSPNSVLPLLGKTAENEGNYFPYNLILLELPQSKSYAKRERAFKNWPVPIRIRKPSACGVLPSATLGVEAKRYNGEKHLSFTPGSIVCYLCDSLNSLSPCFFV